MVRIAPLDEKNRYRMKTYGSTNPPNIIGTGMATGGLNSTYMEKVLGMGIEGIELDQGHAFEEPIGKDGIARLKELLDLRGEEFSASGFDMRHVNQMKDKEGKAMTFWGKIKVGEIFTAEEIKSLEAETGLEDLRKLEITKNATPDFLIYPSSRSRKPYAGADAKLRIYADWKLMTQSENPVIPGLPGSGKPYYGDELTNEVLPSEYDQIQWFYDLIPSLKRFYLFPCSLTQPGSTRVYCVEKDAPRILQLNRAVALFHIRYVMTLTEPPRDNSDYCNWMMKQRAQNSDNVRPACVESYELAVSIGALRCEMAERQAVLDTKLNELKDFIHEDKGLNFNEGPGFEKYGKKLGRTTFNTNKNGGRTLLLGKKFPNKLAAEMQEGLNQCQTN